VSDLYSAAGNMWTDPNRSQTHECGIGTEAAQLTDNEYINEIFVAVRALHTFNKYNIEYTVFTIIHIFRY
jgi:hypothetical protein